MPPFRFHDELVRKLDDKTRRRAWRIALIRSKVFLRPWVITKLLFLCLAVAYVLTGPLQGVKGAWIPITIALPFFIPFLLHRDYEKHVQPELINVAKALKHGSKVSF